MTTFDCVSSLPLPYGIRVTTITSLRTTVWAAFPCPTAYALLLLHDYVLLFEQPPLALLHMRYYYYMTTYYCVSSLPLPYGIRVTTITILSTTVWAACLCPTAYALLLLHGYVRLCEQLALALRHTRYYIYMATYDCVSSLPLPYDIRVTTITWLRTTALALRHTRYYYYITMYYCVSSLPLPYDIHYLTSLYRYLPFMTFAYKYVNRIFFLWIKCLWPQTTCTYYTISRVYIGNSHLWLLHKSMWIDSLWIKCLWPQTTCTYTITRVYIGISHLWLLHKSMWIDSLWIKCLWPQTTCTYTISRVYIGISHLWLLHKSMWIEKNKVVNQMFMTSNCLYIHYLTSLYRYLPFMTFA